MNFNILQTADDLGLSIQKKGLRPIFVADRRLIELHGVPFEAPCVTFAPGEGSKCREVKAELEDAIFSIGIDQRTCIVGYGGGVALDLSGFIAATLHRGVHLAFIPTTLLAFVDAAIGGKNGVNTPYGKNLIGTIYPPEMICIDMGYLKTLPQEEIESGSAEMIKHALLADPALLCEPLSRDLILRHIEIKHSFVKSRRYCLNFGHTIAHAIEALSNYTTSHGHAVLKGMWIEAQLSQCRKIDSFAKYLDTRPLDYTADELWKQMLRDKKCQEGRVFISSLRAPGEPGPLLPITLEMLADVLSHAATW